MIRYPKALATIDEDVAQENAGWQKKAKQRTMLLTEIGRYVEEYTDPQGRKRNLTPFWADVKLVYMRRQQHKCVYCETKLEGMEFSKVQWDLEHFRPKSSVHKWPTNNLKFKYNFSTGDAWPSGYYLLAYHLHNYAAACKTCNSPFKSDFFPIAAARVKDKSHPYDYRSENAFLVYPLGIDDEDPEDLITFTGAKAIPTHEQSQDAPKWRRGRIMIDFFGLNRDGLVYNRATWLLRTVWSNVKLAREGDNDAVLNVEWLRSEKAQYTSCAKCFIDLCKTDADASHRMLSILKQIIKEMEE